MADALKVKSKATIWFYEDSFEKPEVELSGGWTGRDINRAGFLIVKAYRRHLRDLQRAGKATLEEVAKQELAALQGAPEEEATPPSPTEEASNGKA